jgi:hypothetical protein
VTSPPNPAPGADAPSHNAPPDVFISYAREDRPDAERLSSILSARGWSVWQDGRLSGGDVWKDEIARALEAARCVVVLWSKASTASHWVLDEAGEARRRGILVPVLLDDTAIPLGFRQIHAVDLSESADDANGVRDLVAAVARLVGRPPAPPIVRSPLQRLVRTWLPRVAAALPLVIAAALHLVRVDRTTIDLEVRASALSFELTQQQEVAALLLASSVEVAGLRFAHLPRTRSRPEQVLTGTGDRQLALRIGVPDDLPSPGAITLPPVSGARGARVTLAAAAHPSDYHISIAPATVPLQVNVQGVTDVTGSRGSTERMDFGAPKPIVLEPDEGGADIRVRLIVRPPSLLTAPVSVDSLSLVRIEERVQAGQTAVTLVSTILSGTLRLEALGAARALGPGERLRFDGSTGELQALQLTDGALSMRFRGEVRGMETCVLDRCESRMPTRLQSLTARHMPFALASAFGYLVYLALIGRRRIGRR